MDGHTRFYKQAIKMHPHPDDVEMTAFQSPKGMFC